MPQKTRARITGVAPKRNRAGDETGWFAITTDGTPKTLETSQQELIQEAYRWKESGLLLDIDFEEQESSTINQRTGKPFVNRYYNGAAAAKETDDEVAVAAGTREFGWRTHPEDAWRISLSVGLERAVELAELEEPRNLDPDRIWHLAYGFAVKLYTTPKPTTPKQAGEEIAFGAKPTAAEPPPYIDDDWPGD